MAETPSTCAICGALITENRGAELVKLPGKDELVPVHPACKGRPLPSANRDPNDT